MRKKGAESYGTAESVRTPTADRCNHEGRESPSMVRNVKPPGDTRRGRANARSSERASPGRQNQGQCGVAPSGCETGSGRDLTGRRWEKSRRQLFWPPRLAASPTRQTKKAGPEGPACCLRLGMIPKVGSRFSEEIMPRQRKGMIRKAGIAFRKRSCP